MASSINKLNFHRDVHASKGIMPLKTGPKTVEQTIRQLARKAQQKMKTKNTALLMKQVAWLDESTTFLNEFFRERLKKRFAWNISKPTVTEEEILAATVAIMLKASDYEIVGAGTGL
jgi:hypothetical protein